MKIDATSKVHPRQSSSRLSAVQTSRIGCRRRQARQGFLFFAPYFGMTWRMDDADTSRTNAGEARHSSRLDSVSEIIEYTRNVSAVNRIRKAANEVTFGRHEAGPNLKQYT